MPDEVTSETPILSKYSVSLGSLRPREVEATSEEHAIELFNQYYGIRDSDHKHKVSFASEHGDADETTTTGEGEDDHEHE